MVLDTSDAFEVRICSGGRQLISRLELRMPASKRPNKDVRLKRLLEAGFFPGELPPPFVSADFARYRKYLLREWPANELKSFISEPEIYTVPRFGRARRRLSVINPINHFKVSVLIANEWTEIRNFLRKSRISEFKPVFDLEGDRAFFGIDFSSIEKRTIELLSRYRSCLRTDISRYYHTIYTHSIPWALYGKAFCKQKLRDPLFLSSLGNRLDIAVRQGQHNQTIGVPVGPDTSRVIGEMIGVGLERLIEQSLDKFSERSLRYVDDLTIGYDERDSVEALLSAITKSFSHFELDINIEKTGILGVGEAVSPEWLSPLRSFRISAKPNQQQADIEHYFKSSLYFADVNPKDRVLVYAIKRTRSFAISDHVWPYYIGFLLRLCRKDSSCLPAAAQIIIEGNFRRRPID
ncbi:MAG: RNA-directed DNA polymerase, partial [Pseudorhodoplanes sp.]